MKKVKLLRKRFNQILEILVFLSVLAVFIFSLYKILNFIGALKTDVFGVSCHSCHTCQKTGWGDNFCERLREWCGRWCPSCPSPTPRPSPEPSPSPTPSPSPSATPTPSPSPTPESSPAESPGVGGLVEEPGRPPICGAETPTAPTLLNVTPSGTGQVDLSWTAVTPVTHYSISYGLSSRDYIYGVDNTGNVTSFRVGELDPGATYCFAVRAVHDCAPSELSNEICTGAVLGVVDGRILGVSTLGETGNSLDELFHLSFIIGCVCLTLGIRIYLLQKKVA